jgi:uncharacterized membrane protein
MDSTTPIVLAAAKYKDRDSAVEDYKAVWAAHKDGQFDHTSVAVLTKDSDGKLQLERHDTTTKHLAWAGAALVVVAPAVGAAAALSGAGAGAIVGHLWHNIPKEKLNEASDLLESGQSGLVIVAVNKQGSDIKPLLAHAEKTAIFDTVAGDLQAEIDKEIAAAKAAQA